VTNDSSSTTPPGKRPVRSSQPTNKQRISQSKPGARRGGSGPDLPPDLAKKPAPLADFARHAAVLSVARQCRLYPDFDLTMPGRIITGFAEAGAMNPRDEALAHAIYDAVVRRWLTLEYLLSRSLTQPVTQLEPRLRAVLLCGAAQLVLLDKLPAHAVLNHAVEWAKQVIRPGAGAMTNAVLRKVAELVPADRAATRRDTWTDCLDELPLSDGTAAGFCGLVLPEDPLERLSIATSHTPALIDAWVRQHGIATTRTLAMHSLATAPVVLCTRYAAEPIEDPRLVPHDQPGSMVFDGSHGSLAEVLQRRPDVWVQDAASSEPVELVVSSGVAPKLIFDLCAGQGTKTRQLAKAFPNARIVASDIDAERLAVLTEFFKASEQVSVQPLDSVVLQWHSQADLVLLDVPCSNTGVLARRPEAKYRLDAPHMKALTDMQRQIIANSIALLREGQRGQILYSTCSLEPAENQDPVAWVEKWHKLATIAKRSRMPRGGPGGEARSYSDGSFAALLG
jgi:16S rRNA (cytosine967-C5)-methyltransferase